MKILLKLFSQAAMTEKWNPETANEKLSDLLSFAESRSITIWHAKSDLPLKDSFRKHVTKNLLLNLNGRQVAIPLNKTHDFFKYQYPGDKVANGKLRSKVTAAKGLKSLETLNLIRTSELTDISALANLKLQQVYIRDCKMKKEDFPEHLQDSIDLQSN